MACMVPTFVVVFTLVSFFFQLRRAAKSLHHMAPSNLTQIVTYLFEVADQDGTGAIDEQEFQTIFTSVGQQNKDANDSKVPNIKKMMLSLGGTKARLNHHASVAAIRSTPVVLTKAIFLKAAKAGKLGPIFGDRWALWVEQRRLRSENMSFMLIVLFLVHAPVSQKLLLYFACQNIGNVGRSFLRADYSLECGGEKHASFVPFVMLYISLFTVLLPLAIQLQLFRNRKNLMEAETRHKYGFLYRRFNTGSEFWEIFELIRKCLLTGFLVFFPPTSRSAAAILICVLACCSVNFFKPHRNRIVLRVAQCSFLLSTLKYLAAMLLATSSSVVGSTGSGSTGTTMTTAATQDSDIIGWMLVMIDVVFAVGAVASIVAVVYVLRQTVVLKGKIRLPVMVHQEEGDHVRQQQKKSVERLAAAVKRRPPVRGVGGSSSKSLVRVQQLQTASESEQRKTKKKMNNADRVEDSFPALNFSTLELPSFEELELPALNLKKQRFVL